MQLTDSDIDYLARHGKGGIYAIGIVGDHRAYIGQTGSTVGIRERIAQHRRALRRGKHCNARLQNAWNKYGEESFEAYVIEAVPDESLDAREIYWIRAYHAYSADGGFNVCEGGGFALGPPMRRPEVRAKVSEAMKRRYEDPAERVKFSGDNNPSKRPDVRKRISESRQGMVFSERHRANLSASHTGKTQSPETIAKRAASISATKRRRSPERKAEIGAKIWATRRANAERKRRAMILANLAVIVPIAA